MPAQADAPPAPAPVAEVPALRSIAIATNLPFLWPSGDTFGASLSVNLSTRHALRANVATYKNHGPVFADAVGGFLGGESPSYSGRITDVGVSWVFYPRRLWDGFLLEAGGLRRARNVGVSDDEASFGLTHKRSTVYAGRVVVGWSWLIAGHFFVAAAAGVSAGWESGTQVARDEFLPGEMTTHVARDDVHGEAYVRIGAAFDL